MENAVKSKKLSKEENIKNENLVIYPDKRCIRGVEDGGVRTYKCCLDMVWDYVDNIVEQQRELVNKGLLHPDKELSKFEVLHEVIITCLR